MFFHSFTYSVKTLFRNRPQLFWCLAFPILLATMFHFAFGGLSSDESFHAIPVALVVENPDNTILTDTISSLSDSDDALLSVTETDETEAKRLLSKKKVVGILYAGDSLTLALSDQMKTSQIEQSILSAFTEQYNMKASALSEIAKTNPEKLPDTYESLSKNVSYLSDTSFSEGSHDESLTYFFNLIAMTCLYASMTGSNIAIDNQANLSDLGKRRNISPVHKLVSIFAGLCAAVLFQFTSIVLGLLYMANLLGVDFGNQMGYVLLAGLVGCITGVSLGFFVGCIGRADRSTKFGVLMSVVMIGSLLSGLMIGNMRMLVEQHCPFINRINPAALISDSLYALVIYPSHERYFTNVLTLIILSLLFSFGGFLLVRRKKYASL